MGAEIDFSNPEALEWFHSQLDKVLDMGIDGFKNDGTDPYVMLMQFPWGVWGHSGYMWWSTYRDLYYGSYFRYVREKTNNEGLTMARPVDSY